MWVGDTKMKPMMREVIQNGYRYNSGGIVIQTNMGRDQTQMYG